MFLLTTMYFWNCCWVVFFVDFTMYVSSYHLLLGDEVVELIGSGSLSHANGLFAITLYLKQTYKIGSLKL